MLKKIKRSLMLMAALCMAGAMLAGCGNAGGGSKSYDLYIYNGKTENAETMDALAKLYEEQTGLKVKVLSVGDSEARNTLRSELNSTKEKPSIFSVGAGQLEEYVEGGFALSLSEVQTDEMKALGDSVPEGIRLQVEAGDNYGIPYNIEGYGLIVNTDVLADVFKLDDTEAFINDFKAATYEEFQNLVKAVDVFINETAESTITLNGHSYSTADSKTDKTSDLNGVFALQGAEKWTYGDHYSNYALNTVFPTLAASMNATAEDVQKLETALYKSLDEMEFLTNYSAGPDKAIKRSPDFINSTKTSYDQAVQTFTEGKALFIKQGNWVYATIEKLDSDFAAKLRILPMKTSYTDEDIQTGMSAAQFNASIPEFVPSYYVINKKVSQEEQKLAEDFLVWLNTSEMGQDYIINTFAFVPFNATGDMTFDNPLSQDIALYMSEGNILSNPFNGAPNSWGQEAFGKILMEELFIKEEWTDAERDNFVEQCISKWIDSLGQ